MTVSLANSSESASGSFLPALTMFNVKFFLFA